MATHQANAHDDDLPPNSQEENAAGAPENQAATSGDSSDYDQAATSGDHGKDSHRESQGNEPGNAASELEALKATLTGANAEGDQAATSGDPDEAQNNEDQDPSDTSAATSGDEKPKDQAEPKDQKQDKATKDEGKPEDEPAEPSKAEMKGWPAKAVKSITRALATNAKIKAENAQLGKGIDQLVTTCNRAGVAPAKVLALIEVTGAAAKGDAKAIAELDRFIGRKSEAPAPALDRAAVESAMAEVLEIAQETMDATTAQRFLSAKLDALLGAKPPAPKATETKPQERPQAPREQAPPSQTDAAAMRDHARALLTAKGELVQKMGQSAGEAAYAAIQAEAMAMVHLDPKDFGRFVSQSRDLRLVQFNQRQVRRPPVVAKPSTTTTERTRSPAEKELSEVRGLLTGRR